MTVRRILRISVRASAATLIIVVTSAAPALAQVTVDSGTLNNFRDTRSLNDVGIGQGDRDQFGADISPNSAGTTITGIQGGFTVGPNLCGPLAVNPKFCATAPLFSPSRTGSWDVTFTNGTNRTGAVTPALDPSAASPAPFPQSVTITPDPSLPNRPTISWIVPGGFTADAVRINVFDKSVILANGQADIIHSQALPAGQTNFTFPAVLNSGQTLNPGGHYVFNVQLIETRGHVDFSSNNNALIARRSSSFFDFSSPAPGSPPVIALPTVGPAPDPSTGLGATYHFSVGSVGPGSVTFIDPFIAIGYDYAIGTGDPNFASVRLPAIQSHPFLLSFSGEPSGVPVNLLGGVQYFFPALGIGSFGVRGIDVSDNLDPANVTAFVTGLTFVTDGSFTGTMTPVIQFASTAVPEPSTLFLVTVAGCAVGSFAWRRRQRK